MSKLQKKPSALKREHISLQKIKFITFFLCLWVISALLDPDCESDPNTDLGTPLNPDPDSNPDPQHWLNLIKIADSDEALWYFA
jgi:hypothetical protein